MKVVGDPQRFETRLLRHLGLADQLPRGVLLGRQKVPIATHGSASSARAGGATGIASRATRHNEGYSAERPDQRLETLAAAQVRGERPRVPIDEGIGQLCAADPEAGRYDTFRRRMQNEAPAPRPSRL